MVGDVGADTLTKISTEAAAEFVESYYPALESSRGSVSSFYAPPSTLPDGKTLPVLVFNGNVIPNPTALQELFEKQMPEARYEVQSYDCHVLNPRYNADGATDDAEAKANGNRSTRPRISLALTVSGYAKYGDVKDGTMRGFSESIILVPRPETGKEGARRGKAKKKYLVQSQNFRLVV
ncbi:MAG: hypothetical protein M1825_000268 [Sarcosagium campestre]|nr:MAG: hypothetical protein M1825_000268 [Sarcosagium campestre]